MNLLQNIILTLGLVACTTSNGFNTNQSGGIIDQIRRGNDIVQIGTTISEAIELGDLFSVHEQSFEVRGEWLFVDCTFEEDIIWKDSEGRTVRFRDDITFKNCEFKGNVIINDAAFEGNFKMLDCVVAKDLDLQRNTFFYPVRITGCKTGNDMTLQYSRFHEDVTFLDSEVGRHVLCQGLSVYGKSQFGNLSSSGSVDLSNSDFHENFSANYMSIGGKILTSNCRFHGDFSMNQFEAGGSVSIKNSRVMGQFLLGAKDSMAEIIDTDFMHFDLDQKK
ncbi:MAG: hypothetical protein R3275_07770 [Saprospiraceae bacterium]|nr:hypothetical protein [Saprospiraceae bacterium]